MKRTFFEGINFENKVFQTGFETGDYENCVFSNCDFTEGHLSDSTFIDCEFRECNLSLTKLILTTFREVKFTGCKLVGLHFEDCNKMFLSIGFDRSNLEVCSFNGLKLKKTVFMNSRIIEADFTRADMSYSLFINSDLQRSIFMNTNIEGADFRSAFNYIIDPDSNKIKKAKFSLSGIPGLLCKYDIDIEK